MVDAGLKLNLFYTKICNFPIALCSAEEMNIGEKAAAGYKEIIDILIH